MAEVEHNEKFQPQVTSTQIHKALLENPSGALGEARRIYNCFFGIYEFVGLAICNVRYSKFADKEAMVDSLMEEKKSAGLHRSHPDFPSREAVFESNCILQGLCCNLRLQDL